MEEQTWNNQDLAIYLLMFLIISVGFNFFPSRWLEIFTARVSSIILNIIGLNSEFGFEKGFAYLTLVGARNVRVIIVRECTGIHVWGIVTGLLIPLKYGSWPRKGLGLLVGALIITILNLSRIILTLYLTAFNIPPLSWFFQSPTVATYHYPISFLYGVIGIMIILLVINTYILQEIGDLLAAIPEKLYKLLLEITKQ